MNKLFTNVADFAQIPSVNGNTADKLLSYILPKDSAAAVSICWPGPGGEYCQRIARYVGQWVSNQCCLGPQTIICRPKATGRGYCNPGV